MPIKHLLVQTNPKWKHVGQMLAFPDSAVRFIQTHFYYPYQFTCIPDLLRTIYVLCQQTCMIYTIAVCAVKNY